MPPPIRGGGIINISCLFLRQGRVQDFSLRSKTEGPKAVRGEVGFLGTETPSPPATGSGERCKLPSGVGGGAPTPKGFSTIFSTQDGLS